MQAYFIGGLGCNVYYPQDLMAELPFEIKYVDLYHDSVFPFLESMETFAAWFEKKVDISEDIFLIAHSLGADLAVALAARYECVHLVLLDGGFLDMDKICSLEDELSGAKFYLEQTRFESLEKAVEVEKASSLFWTEHLEKAVRNSYVYDEVSQSFALNFSFDLVKSLLHLRRQVFGQIDKIAGSVLLLIPALDEDTPAWKKEALSTLPSHVRICEVRDTGHSLYTEKPKEVASIIYEEWEKILTAKRGS
ncbi:alpha/beta hydrolase [Streptococcus pneumoniae]